MKALYILSKTDIRMISRCNARTKMHQRGLGLFVLLTSLFAFFAGYYALVTIFGYWDEFNQEYVLTYKDRLIVTSCALLYALMIASIDREIVSAKNKWAALLRIPLAIAIGIVISVPLKLKILEGKINQKIKQEQISTMLPFKQERDQFIANSDSAIGNLELQINYYKKLKLEEQKRMEGEDLGLFGENLSGIAGQGTHFGYAKRNVDNYSRIIKDLEGELEEKKAYKAERLTQLESDSKSYTTHAEYDFWSKIGAMHRLVDQDETSRSKAMVIGLTLLFIFLEVIPSIMKLLAPENEYDLVCQYVDTVIKRKLEHSLDEYDNDWDPDGFIPIPEIQVS